MQDRSVAWIVRVRTAAARLRPRRDRLIAGTTLVIAAALPIARRMPFLTWVSCKVDRWFFKRKGWPGDVDTHRERTLFWLLKRATDQGIRYDLSVTHRGRDQLDRAISEGHGVLIVGIHSALLYLAGRYLHDLPIRSEFVGYDLDTRIFGTDFLPDYLRTDGSVLIKTRRLLKEGAAVFVMIDGVTKGRKMVRFEYAGDTILLSRASIDVAIASGATIVFMNAFMSGNRPLLYWGAPAPADASDANLVLAAFRRFLTASLADRR